MGKVKNTCRCSETRKFIRFSLWERHDRSEQAILRHFSLLLIDIRIKNRCDNYVLCLTLLFERWSHLVVCLSELVHKCKIWWIERRPVLHYLLYFSSFFILHILTYRTITQLIDYRVVDGRVIGYFCRRFFFLSTNVDCANDVWKKIAFFDFLFKRKCSINAISKDDVIFVWV